MTNQTADYSFIVKELASANGSDWALECCPKSEQFKFISNKGCMYIRLKPNASEDDAKQLQKLLNEHVANFTIVD